MLQLINQEKDKLEKEGHSIIKTEKNRNGNHLILYSPRHNKDYIFARIIRIDGSVSSFINDDIKMFVSKQRTTNSFHINNIFIYGENQNQGYGSILMNQLIENARIQFIDFIDGYMTPPHDEVHEQRLRHFYKKHGFTIDQHRNILWKRNRITIKL